MEIARPLEDGRVRASPPRAGRLRLTIGTATMGTPIAHRDGAVGA